MAVLQIIKQASLWATLWPGRLHLSVAHCKLQAVWTNWFFCSYVSWGCQSRRSSIANVRANAVNSRLIYPVVNRKLQPSGQGFLQVGKNKMELMAFCRSEWCSGRISIGQQGDHYVTDGGHCYHLAMTNSGVSSQVCSTLNSTQEEADTSFSHAAKTVSAQLSSLLTRMLQYWLLITATLLMCVSCSWQGKAEMRDSWTSGEHLGETLCNALVGGKPSLAAIQACFLVEARRQHSNS